MRRSSLSPQTNRIRSTVQEPEVSLSYLNSPDSLGDARRDLFSGALAICMKYLAMHKFKWNFKGGVMNINAQECIFVSSKESFELPFHHFSFVVY